MPDITDRLALPFPELDESADGPLAFEALAQALDPITVTWDQGLEADRPVAPVIDGGLIWWSSDTKVFSYWDGTAWNDLGNIPLGSITRAMLHAQLKPAPDGTLAADETGIRALGTTSITAAAGNDNRFPTTDEKHAMAGTSGHPATGNEYVTKADPRMLTQNENDAAQGTHGSPSNTNRFVTNDDPRLIPFQPGPTPLPPPPPAAYTQTATMTNDVDVSDAEWHTGPFFVLPAGKYNVQGKVQFSTETGHSKLYHVNLEDSTGHIWDQTTIGTTQPFMVAPPLIAILDMATQRTVRIRVMVEDDPPGDPPHGPVLLVALGSVLVASQLS